MPRIRQAVTGTEYVTGSGFISGPARLKLRELDDLPGSYPTVLRTGDATRAGNLRTSFNDGTSIVFSESENVVFPMMLPKGSSFASQAVDIVGQESDISASLPLRPFQQPTHLHYSPVEEMGPFDENRVSSNTETYLSGTDPTVLPGFSSPLRSKIKIEIDITPQSNTTFTRNKSSVNALEGCPAGSNNTGFMYYNFSRREWEQIGLNDPATGAALNHDYRVTAGSPPPELPAQFSISPGFPYIARQYTNLLGYDKIGTPTSTFGAPSNRIYHATSSQALKMSNYISRPFLLEAVDVEFEKIRAQRIQGRDFVPAQTNATLAGGQGNAWERLYHSGTIRDIDNYVFFAYRQKRNNRIVDSIDDISSSDRYLIFSSSLTFWNSSAFMSENARSDFDPEKFSLQHGPSFSYDFNLELSSTFDKKLTTWDPTNQTYRVDNVLVDVRSSVLAHFNFDDAQSYPGVVEDKSGNITAPAIIGPDPSSAVVKVAYDYPGNLFDSYYKNPYGYLDRGWLKNFSGAGGSLQITDASTLVFSGARSISFWIRPISTPGLVQYILSKAAAGSNLTDYAILFTATPRLEFRVYDTTATDHTSRYIYARLTSALYTPMGDEWHHITCTWSGASAPSSLNIYVNGQNVSQTKGYDTTPTLSSAKVTAASPVKVGQLGLTTDYFLGGIGSLEFYSTALNGSTVKSLYLLQQTHYTNPAIYAVGNFTGSFFANVKPSVANRQVHGLSTYHSNGVQNAWIGGTAGERYYTSNWNFGSSENLNPFLETAGGSMLNASVFVPKIDHRSSKFLGNDSVSENNLSVINFQRSDLGKSPSLRADRSLQSAISPYLLMPDDELIFGMDAGLCSMPAYYPGNVSSLTGSHLVIENRPCKVTLYGSIVENGVEGIVSLNQNLDSSSVHEVIGAEPIVDQYQIEPRSAYYGSYTDEIVTGSMAILNSDGITFTIYDQNNSRRVIRRLSS